MTSQGDSGAKSADPAIIENYHDYTPPRKTRESVELLLRYVPPEYLVGPQSIVLSNIDAFSRSERRGKTWGRRGKGPLTRTRGWYSAATRVSPASIRMNIDRISQVEFDWARHVPLVRYAALADVLYHEIGHHIHKQRRPVYEGKENVADYWSTKLWVDFVRARYPYAVPALWLLRKVMRAVGHPTRRVKSPYPRTSK